MGTRDEGGLPALRRTTRRRARGAPRRRARPAPGRVQSLDEFLDLVTRTGRVRPVEVHKRRVRYTVDGCTSEVTDVVADGRTTRTIAIESEDRRPSSRRSARWALAGFVNTSYPRGLTALVEDRRPRYAVIDVGTNSVKFHVGELDPDGRLAHRRRPRRGHAPRRGHRGDTARSPPRRWTGRLRDRGHGRRGAAEWRARHRSRRHGGPARGSQPG